MSNRRSVARWQQEAYLHHVLATGIGLKPDPLRWGFPRVSTAPTRWETFASGLNTRLMEMTAYRTEAIAEMAARMLAEHDRG
jgi:hypothetical protein